MATVPPMSTGLAAYTVTDLEALEQERPELGRLEVIDGVLYATGGSAVGDLHQLVVQRLHLLFAAACPDTSIIRLDTWWVSARGKVRPDLAVYRPEDRPATRRAFRVPPSATLEVLSEDAHHDLVRKDAVYAAFGVAHRAYVEPWGRYPWWCRVEGVDHDGPVAEWRLGGWPPLRLVRDDLLAD